MLIKCNQTVIVWKSFQKSLITWNTLHKIDILLFDRFENIFLIMNIKCFEITERTFTKCYLYKMIMYILALCNLVLYSLILCMSTILFKTLFRTGTTMSLNTWSCYIHHYLCSMYVSLCMQKKGIYFFEISNFGAYALELIGHFD